MQAGAKLEVGIQSESGKIRRPILDVIDFLPEGAILSAMLQMQIGDPARCPHCNSLLDPSNSEKLLGGLQSYCVACRRKSVGVTGTPFLYGSRLGWQRLFKLLVLIDIGATDKAIRRRLGLHVNVIRTWRSRVGQGPIDA